MGVDIGLFRVEPATALSFDMDWEKTGTERCVCAVICSEELHGIVSIRTLGGNGSR